MLLLAAICSQKYDCFWLYYLDKDLKRIKTLKKKYSIIIIMDNQEIVKRGRGRPKKLTDEERKNNKSLYMLQTEWFCDICETGCNYTLAGKHCHLKTKKHQKNIRAHNMMERIHAITYKLNP